MNGTPSVGPLMPFSRSASFWSRAVPTRRDRAHAAIVSWSTSASAALGALDVSIAVAAVVANGRFLQTEI